MLTIAGGVLLAVIGAFLLLAYGRAILLGVPILSGLAFILLALYEAPIIGGCIVAFLVGVVAVLVLWTRYGHRDPPDDPDSTPPRKCIGRDPRTGRFRALLSDPKCEGGT